MSISSIGSRNSIYAQWLKVIQREPQSAASSQAVAAPRSSSRDTAAISQQGLAALLQDHSVQMESQPSDAQAAQIGSQIQRSVPAVFKAFDTNGDGALSAKELQSGVGKLTSALQSTSAPQFTDTQAAQIGSNIQKNNPELFKALDTSGDGKLSVSELQDGLKKLQAAGMHHREQHFHVSADNDANQINGAQESEMNSKAVQAGLTSTQSPASASHADKYHQNLMQEVLQKLTNIAQKAQRD